MNELIEGLNQTLELCARFIWNTPLVVVLIGTGIFFTIILRGIQIRGFIHGIELIMGKHSDTHDPGQISHFHALCTALSATVGLGNIAGVAIAVSTGGPGAVFWMILAGFIGMATKFAECTLAVKYRKIDHQGVVHGGPMYYIEKGLGPRWKPLALFFAFATLCASFGAANMFQANQVASILHSTFSLPKWTTGITLSLLTAVVIVGGIKRIGSVTSVLVPFMGILYCLGALIIIFLNTDKIPDLIFSVVHDAFNGSAALGAFQGIALKTAIIQGVRRACFSNEAGLGSSAIAHSAVSTKEPVTEGVVALLEPFIDTVVICTMTALVILLSGLWTQPLGGVELTAAAFNHSIPGFGTYFVPLAVFLFAYSTLISWSYYGERALDYLTRGKGLLIYKTLFCFLALVGSLWSIDPILNFSDIMLGLMAAPNLIALLILSPTVIRETEKYFKKRKETL